MRLAALAAVLFLLSSIVPPAPARADTPKRDAGGNRLVYLDEPANPYYVGRDFPKLTTPQWVGEAGVKAVVVLAIDDLRGLKPDGVQKYETFIRPILDRLKRIDGRAPLSIMTCQVDPKSPHLQTWLKEVVSLEAHSFDHPCPILQGGDFAKAKATYDKSVDQLFEIPGNVPVAFRTPCCDSRNTVSPRLFAEILNQTTPAGHFLQVDSSVFNITTSKDPSLPREITTDADGKERFRKYLPFEKFVNTIEDYPYPYLIGTCWEFPCAIPSDWEAQNLHKPNNPKTTEDWKAQLDATVIKEGVFTFVFHPHGWSKPEQFVEFIDYAEQQYGKSVKFLSFRDCLERINKHLLEGHPVRDEKGRDNGVRLIDLNADGFLDVVAAGPLLRSARVWEPTARRWRAYSFPTAAVDVNGADAGLRFGSVGGRTAVISPQRAWFLDGEKGTLDLALFSAEPGDAEIYRVREKLLRDLDGDGSCELIADLDTRGLVFRWSGEKWERLPFQLPDDTPLVSKDGGDAGVRFVDVNEDGQLDLLVSRPDRYAVHLFKTMTEGWSPAAVTGKRGDRPAVGEIPPIVRADGSNNGFFVHSRMLCWQNEDTDKLPNLIDTRSFDDLLKDVRPGPKSPEQALKTMRLRPGFEIELAAAEPLTTDPVAFAWGADGKLWVAEMGDYPLGADGKGAPGGVIRFLTDTDGDGKYDQSTVFLDKVPYPTGVTPWRKGVLVCSAPDLFYAEDTDGDGKADKREVLFTGFGEGNQQHRFNGLVYGLDNWFYGANGDSGGRVKSLKAGKTLDLGRGKDFRLRPDTGEIEPETGSSQFGRTRDDWGNWFGCNNSNPNYHFVIPDRYLRRNAQAAGIVSPRHDVPAVPGAAPIYPASKVVARFNDFDKASRITSANGICIYRDDLFGPEFTGNSFVSEPVHNLIHREVMEPDGVTFKSRRADDEQTSEFLASTDGWCRPTQIKTGPDGALWFADMYRDVIEHPEWIPKDWQKRLDLRAGHDKGRIYRVFPTGKKPRAIPRLDKLDTAGLVAAIDSPSGWQRDMAQQLLVERQDKAAVPLLERMISTAERPQARLHALCALDALGTVAGKILRTAMRDAHPGVVRHAVRIAEPVLGEAAAQDGLAAVAQSEDAAVQLQLAFSLREWNELGPMLADLATRGPSGDGYLRAAVLSAVTEKNVAAFAKSLLAARRRPAPALVVGLATAAIEAEDARTATLLIQSLVPPGPPRSRETFEAVATACALLEAQALPLRRFFPPDSEAFTRPADPDTRVADAFAPVLDAALAAAGDASAAEGERVAAIRLLGRGGGPERDKAHLSALVALTALKSSPALRSEAVVSLGRIGKPEALDALIKGWRSYGPADRSVVLDALLGRREGTNALLVALSSGEIPPRDIDAERRQRLMRSNNRDVRERAEALFASEPVNKDRQKVIDAFAASLDVQGDAAKGKPLFEKLCASCHKLGDVGHAVGPDLAGLADPSPGYLLTHILDPNRAVEAKYANYVVETTRGQTYSGILSAEAGESVTILQAQGLAQTVARPEMKQMRSTGLSLMPDGLEAGLQPGDMADLMAFAASGRAAPARKAFKGNEPAVVRPQPDGMIRLAPAAAEIYGPSIVLEERYGNLGYWSDAQDHAAWAIETTKPGRYAVWIEFACEDGSAGNAIAVSSGASRATSKVPGTGNWDTYWRQRIGEIELRPGRQRVTVKPEGKLNGALLDLKGVELVPAE